MDKFTSGQAGETSCRSIILALQSALEAPPHMDGDRLSRVALALQGQLIVIEINAPHAPIETRICSDQRIAAFPVQPIPWSILR